MQAGLLIWPAVGAAVAGTDLAVKRYVERTMDVGEERALAGSAEKGVVLRRTENRGFALNSLDRHPRIVGGVSAAATAAAAGACALAVIGGTGHLTAAGLSLMTGGGVSNTADRIVRKRVTDYLAFRRGKQAAGPAAQGGREIVYDIGDLAIFAGAALTVAGAFLGR